MCLNRQINENCYYALYHKFHSHWVMLNNFFIFHSKLNIEQLSSSTHIPIELRYMCWILLKWWTNSVLFRCRRTHPSEIPLHLMKTIILLISCGFTTQFISSKSLPQIFIVLFDISRTCEGKPTLQFDWYNILTSYILSKLNWKWNAFYMKLLESNSNQIQRNLLKYIYYCLMDRLIGGMRSLCTL